MNKLFYWLSVFIFFGLINPILSRSDLPKKNISEDSKNGNSKINNKEIKYKRFANLAYSERKIFRNNVNEFTLPLNFEKFFNNLLVSFENDSKSKNSNEQELEILADYEEFSGSIISAKGNVIIRNKKAVLNTDSFSYDREKSLLIIEGDIKFKSQNQFLLASKIQYDFKNKKGFILDAYGSVNFDYLSEFLNNEKNDIAIDDNFDEDFKIKKVKLDSSSNLEFGNIIRERKQETSFKNFSDNSINANINPVRRTRFISERINIFDNLWNAETLYLTNDPFNDAQLIVKNLDFKIIVEEEKTKIRTKWSNLIFENNVTIPIGPRRINVDREKTFKWGAGYDKQKFDGFHVFRDFDPIYLNNENETVLDIRSNFLIQRALNGETKSFPEKNQSSISPKITQDANALDYLGLDLIFQSPINNWNYYLLANTNSLDFEKLDKIAEVETFLTKNIYAEEKKHSKILGDLTLFGSFREKTKNGSLGEITVQSSLGGRMDFLKDEKIVNNSDKTILNKTSLLSFTYGEYSSPSKKSPSELINRNRSNLSLKQIYNFHIWEPQKSEFIDASYKFTPETIQRGLYWLLEGNLDFFRYSDNNKQDLFLVKTGPKLVLGEFKKNLLDYSEIGIYPRFKFNNGESPFLFDQVVDIKVIELVARQQIYGPLILKFTGELNLDENITEDDNLINPVLDLSWNRRAYNFAIFYNFDTEVGGFNFKIHSFNFKGLGEKFK